MVCAVNRCRAVSAGPFASGIKSFMHLPIRAIGGDRNSGLDQAPGDQKSFLLRNGLAAVVIKGLPMMQNADDMIREAVSARVTQAEAATVSLHALEAGIGVSDQ